MERQFYFNRRDEKTLRLFITANRRACTPRDTRLLQDIHQKIATNPYKGIDFDMLTYMFFSPRIVARFQTLLTYSLANVQYASAHGEDRRLLQEYFFGIGFREERGVAVSRIYPRGMGITYGLPEEMETLGKLILVAHTHIPKDEPISPSTIMDAADGTQYGDLAALRFWRHQEDRPIFAILQSNPNRHVVGILLIRLGNKYLHQAEDDYLKTLRMQASIMNNLSDQNEVVEKLKQMGYTVSYIELSVDQFTDPIPFGRVDRERLLALL